MSLEIIEINDIRTIKDFKTTTFSNYKKSEVKKQCIKCIYNKNIEEACYWISELCCSGYLIDIWEIIITICSKYIYLANPKLPIYINKRYNTFKEIMENGYIENELMLRNNIEIRKLFIELCCTLCLSSKKPILQIIKPNNNLFDIHNLSQQMIAPNITYISEYFRKEDPKELFISLNELCYLLHEKKETLLIIQWINWILDYEKICKKKKIILKGERRTFANVNEKFQKDIVWIIWEIFLDKSKKKQICKTVVENLLDLFCIKYTENVKRKRKDILFHCVYLIIEHVDYNINIFKDTHLIKNITNKSHNYIYKEIKNNELTPNTDYLFTNIDKKNNLEKTLSKIKKMNEFLN